MDNKFHDFTIAYTADNREIKISYADNSKGTLVWNSAVPTSYGDSLALSVTSSTGGNKNKHQFRLDSLEFTKAASVNVRHIDYFTGKDLVEDTVSYPNGASVGGTYQTAVKDIPGYYYVGLNGTTATITAQGQSVSLPIKVIDKETGKAVENSIPAMGEMQQEGNNGTVVYVYMPIPDKIDVNNAIKQSNVNETIHYVDADTGETIATDYKAPEITFVKGTKAGKTITLYHNDKDGSSTDQTTWSVSNNGSFEEVVNPAIDGYKIQSVEENGVSQADLTAVESKGTFFGDKDKEITVYYVKDNDASVQVRHIDYFTGKDIATDNTLTYSNGAIVGSTYTTNPMNITGYKYVALNGQTIDVKGTKIPINVKGVESSLPASGDLIKGDNGTVTYVYVPTDFQIIKSPVNETIHYVEERTNLPLASDYQADPIVFVQVTRNGKSVVMYHNENDGLSVDDPNAWHNADDQNANFKEVKNPEITGYHVVRNDANSDLNKVEMKSTNYQGADQEYTVYYARDVDALVNVRHIDYFTGKDIVPDNTLTYPNGAHSGENYTSNSMDISGYKYIGLNGSSVTVNLNGQTMTLPINVLRR
ncbi:hypothetical protein ATN92_09880 [Companilactobacillus bobalius]|nr:hypothetical protein ATN92_09880 [Companilactobacillus bobalius]